MMKRTFVVLLWDQTKTAFLSRRVIILASLFFLTCLLVTKAGLVIQNQTTPVGFRMMLASSDDPLPVFLIQAPIFSISIFFSSLLALPLLVLLLRHDIPAREMEQGALRFLTWRVDRRQLLFSRYLAGIIEVAVVILIGFVISWIWAAGNYPHRFGNFAALGANLEMWLRQIPFQAALVSCSLFFSVWAGRARRALSLNLLVYILFLTILASPYLADISLFRGAYIMGLFSRGSRLFISWGVYSLFNLIFLGGAWLIMERKDF